MAEIFIGLACLAGIIWSIANSRSKKISNDDLMSLKSKKNKATNDFGSSRSIEENIRQIGVISKDEFANLYTPIISRVEFYEQLVGSAQVSEEFYKTLYTTLRKKRNVIFEAGSAEDNTALSAYWTYTVFLTVSVRYIVRLLSQYQWFFHDKEVDVFSVSDNKLSILQKKSIDEYHDQFKPTAPNIIPSFTTPELIKKLIDKGMYRYLVCSVSGGNFDTFNAFYKLVDTVESHIRGVEIDDASRFVAAINESIHFLSSHYVGKNQPSSLVFNGRGAFFLVDRSLLWSLFCSAYIYEKTAPSYSDFIEALHRNFKLRLNREKTYTYTIEVDAPLLDDMDEAQVMEITINNVIALPYSEFPMYSPAKKIVIKKTNLARDARVISNTPDEIPDSIPPLDDDESVFRQSQQDIDPVQVFDADSKAQNINSKSTRKKKQQELFNKN